MTSHELAKSLLAMPDRPVGFYDDCGFQDARLPTEETWTVRYMSGENRAVDVIIIGGYY